MRIGIISNKKGYYGNLLIKAANARGHDVSVFPIPDISVLIKKNLNKIVHKGTNLFEMDVILVRGMTRSPCLRVLIEMIHKRGIRIIDQRLIKTYDNNNKFYTYMRLEEEGLPFPKTYYISHPESTHLPQVLENLNTNLPIIAKIGSSSQGKGVYLIRSQKDLAKVINSLNAKERHQLLFQKFLEHVGDIRVIVIGYNVIGAMFRKKKKSEYRSNIAVGATACQLEIDNKIAKLASQAAKAVEIEIAGVDILISEGKPYVIEVNRAPQFKGFMQATGIDVPCEIIKYCEKVKK